MFDQFALLGLSPVTATLVTLVLLLIAAFEIWMLISVITNKSVTDNAKVWWVIGMLLLHPFVAIVYYFTDYQKTRLD